MKKDKTRGWLGAAVLFGIAALISAAGCVRTLSRGQLGFLQFLAAAVLITACIVNLRRYLNSRAEKDEE